MTPSEKAIELMDKFRDENYFTIEDCKANSKHNALITVDEVLKAIPMYTGNLNPTWKFWSDVRDCLNAL
jgi:hypothetical protein